MQNDSNNILIADSSVLVSLFNPEDAYHGHAEQLARQVEKNQTVVVTPEVVLVETTNIIGKKLGHVVAIQVAELILDSEMFLLVPTSELLTKAISKFKTAAEKVSFTDCVVMACADKHNTRSILGFDQDFRDNGYIAPIPLHKP